MDFPDFLVIWVWTLYQDAASQMEITRLELQNESQGLPEDRTGVPSRPGTNGHISRAAVLVDSNGRGRDQCQGGGGLQLDTQYAVAEAEVPGSTWFLVIV